MNAVFHELETQISMRVKRARQAVLIICPFIKLETLHRLIVGRANSVAVTIVCSWKLENFVAGVCDAGLFPYCTDHRITLLANNRVHLKAWLFDRDTLILGSANITDRGLTDSPSSNYEFAIISKASGAEMLHIDNILGESVEIDISVYERTIDALGRHPSGQECYEELLPHGEANVALVDQLPLTPTPQDLCDQYVSHSAGERSLACIHDLDRLRICVGVNRESFLIAAKNGFFSLPIVSQFLERVAESPVYFGESKAILQKLNESDPKPTRRDLTPVTQNLFRWLEELSPDRFVVDRPHQSQRLTMMS